MDLVGWTEEPFLCLVQITSVAVNRIKKATFTKQMQCCAVARIRVLHAILHAFL